MDRPIEKLTQTGCVDPSNPTKPASYMIAYEVNSPLWSDGADKGRYMRIPEGKKVHVTNCKLEATTTCKTDPFTGLDGHWNFPIGTVLMKGFGIENTMLETRLLLKYDDQNWASYSYRWNQEQTEATINPDARTPNVVFTTPSGSVTWNYPSRGDCTQCHTSFAGETLGPETSQLNRIVADNGASVNQLDKLEKLGILDAPLSRPFLSAYVNPTSATGTLTERARSYLHANCGFCHRPDGPEPAIDFRYGVSLKNMGICNVLPSKGDLGVTGALLLYPGHPEKSAIPLRMRTLTRARMPPLASLKIDDAGVAAVEAWIKSVTTCP